MPSTAAELPHLIQTLRQERKHHADAIAESDAAFSSLGITVTCIVASTSEPDVVFG